MVCEQAPERPSGSCTTGLRRALEGDLDTIVLKALRKEPSRRYASVQQFAGDIQNHLSGMPVQARNPTLFYRSSRFLRRHKESAATAMVALTLVGAIGVWEVHRGLTKNSAAEQRPGNVFASPDAPLPCGFRLQESFRAR